YTVISAHNSPFGPGWVVVNPFIGAPVYQKTVNIQWMAKNSKNFIAQAAMDTNGTVVQAFTYLVKKIAIPKVTFVTPNDAQRGQTLDVTISAVNTHFTKGGNIPVNFSQG